MKLVMQSTNTACGQACIAMITGKSIEEIIQTMKTDGPTSIGQLIEALDYYKINHAERNMRISKKNPVPYILPSIANNTVICNAAQGGRKAYGFARAV